MECNKEEAFKAMQIAEKKLQICHFTSAKKMAQTAQRLYPTLENISQLLTICEIHCSAQNKIVGSENDWYGILQIEQSADEATIKKKYRKLALLIHPDKNKFSGAEAAFKLVGQAISLLSDEAKRKVYDMKYKVLMRNVARPKPNGCTKVKRDSRTANGRSSCKSHQQYSFQTCCPFCTMKYRYLKYYVNKNLRCQICGQIFVAYDLNNQTAPETSHESHVPQKKVPPEQGSSGSDVQSKHGSEEKSHDRFAGADRTDRASRDISTSGQKRKVEHENKSHVLQKKVPPERGSSNSDVQSKHGSDKKSHDRFAEADQTDRASRNFNTSVKKQKVQHENVSHVSQKKVPHEPGSSDSDVQSKHGSDKKYHDRFAGADRADQATDRASRDINTPVKKQKVQHENESHVPQTKVPHEPGSSPQKKVPHEPGSSDSDEQSKHGSDKKSHDRFVGADRAAERASRDINNSGKKQKVQQENVKDNQGSFQEYPGCFYNAWGIWFP